MSPAVQFLFAAVAIWSVGLIAFAFGYGIGRYTKIIPWKEETWSTSKR